MMLGQHGWRKNGGARCFHSSYSTYAKGTLIWVAPGAPFMLQYTEADVKGRYVLLRGKLGGKDITILNTYAPNIDEPAFFVTL